MLDISCASDVNDSGWPLSILLRKTKLVLTPDGLLKVVQFIFALFSTLTLKFCLKSIFQGRIILFGGNESLDFHFRQI